MAKCKSCGAEIVWIKTSASKSMPCDAQQVLYWEKPKAKGKIVTRNGEVISCVFEGDLDKATGIGYIPHWGTCSSAASHKRRSGND